MAMLYDTLLVVALVLIATFVVVLARGLEPVPPANPWMQGYLFAVVSLFFLWFWTHGGQTLGMRAWRLKLLTNDGQLIGYPAAVKRLLASLLSWAVLALGFAWMFIDRDRRAWHDIIAGTRVVLVAKS
ncbi:MAG: RDD family protein [Chromatiales bacterium]|nr:RDD family protein [Chromatiales bacterium]